VHHWLVDNSVTVDSDRKQYPTVKTNGMVVTDMTLVKELTTRELYGTVDGSGLSSHSTVPAIHSWVFDETKIFSGSKFIGAVDSVQFFVHQGPSGEKASVSEHEVRDV